MILVITLCLLAGSQRPSPQVARAVQIDTLWAASARRWSAGDIGRALPPLVRAAQLLDAGWPRDLPPGYPLAIKRARVHVELSLLRSLAGQHREAADQAAIALRLFDIAEAPLDYDVLAAHQSLGYVAWRGGRDDDAARLFTVAADGAAVWLGTRIGCELAPSLVYAGMGAQARGERDEAVRRFEMALALCRGRDDTPAVLDARRRLGDLEEERWNFGASIRAYEGLVLSLEAQGASAEDLADVRTKLMDVLRAAKQLDAADRLRASIESEQAAVPPSAPPRRRVKRVHESWEDEDEDVASARPGGSGREG